MVWSDGTTMWAADLSGWVFALLLATEARDSAQDKDTQDKDNRDSSGNNHASRVRSDGAVIQMADRDDSMLYVYELPTKAAMESMDPTWADIRIFKPVRPGPAGARAKHFDIDQGQHRCQVLRRPGVHHRPVRQLERRQPRGYRSARHCQRAGDVRQFRRRLQPFGRVGH